MAEGRSFAERVADQTGVDIPEPPAPAQQSLVAETEKPPARPEWLPDNFESEEAFVKSWRDGQKALTQAQQRAAAAEEATTALAQRLEALEGQANQQQPAYDAASDPWLAAEVQAWEDADYARAAQLRDARTAMMLQAAAQMWQQQQQPDPQQAARQDNVFAMLIENAVAAKFGDEWPQLRNEVVEIIQQNPHFVPDTPDPAKAAEAIAFVANSVRTRRLAEQNARQATQAAHGERQKLLAQTAPGSSGRTPTGQDPADLIVEQWKNLPRSYGSQ